MWSSVLRRWAGYIFAFFAGLAFTLWLVPRGLLFPVNYYDVAAVDDTADHIIGQRYFLLDQWRHPLLKTALLRWPQGTNIALSDSIPLLAIPAKLLKRYLPPGFHSIFWFLALAWCLQPVAAVFALRSTGEKRLLPALAVVVIALSMPTLLYRGLRPHESLCGHFLVLAAIGLYFRISRGSNWPAWLAAPALLVVSLLIHPYLLAMVAAVLMAAPISLLVRRDARRLPVSMAFLAAMALVGSLAYVLGYAEEVGVGHGYGLYAMNLMAPVELAGSALIPFFSAPIAASRTTYEGYQYLGLGVLLLCLVAVARVRVRLPKRACVRHSGLLFVSLGLVIFALSNNVYDGSVLIFHYEHVPRFFNSFRSSGRFFWPVAYLLVIASVVTVARRFSFKAAMAILLIAAGLQFVDATSLRLQLRDHLRRPVPWHIDRQALGALMERSDRVTLWPRFECFGNVLLDPQYLQVLLLASQYRLRTNTMYTPNPKVIGPCNAADVIGTPWEAGELRVILPFPQFDEVHPPNFREGCRPVGHLTACRMPR